MIQKSMKYVNYQIKLLTNYNQDVNIIYVMLILITALFV